jgi:hypothetical protein
LERSRALRSDDTEVNSVDPTEARNINMKVVIHVRPRVSQLVRMLTGRGPEPGEQAAGLAPASQFPQAYTQQSSCVDSPPVCTLPAPICLCVGWSHVGTAERRMSGTRFWMRLGANGHIAGRILVVPLSRLRWPQALSGNDTSITLHQKAGTVSPLAAARLLPLIAVAPYQGTRTLSSLVRLSASSPWQGGHRGGQGFPGAGRAIARSGHLRAGTSGAILTAGLLHHC